jgi:hypothetical protein
MFTVSIEVSTADELFNSDKAKNNENAELLSCSHYHNNHFKEEEILSRFLFKSWY